MPDPDATRKEEKTDGALALGSAEERPAEETGDGENASVADVLGREVGGRGGLDPTRYGDWEINGRCVDF